MTYRDCFQVGGTLDSHHSSYVVRQADKQLLSYLEKGEFCFILNCRQMGKSSLTIKTADRLRNKNFSCAFSDLSILGTSNITPEQWYKSFAYQILESLDLDDIDLDEWWKKYNFLTAIDCLGKLFEKIILTEILTNIVIFIDEIDSIIKLPFKDDFFALIRGCYNKRTIDPNYKRLTFCLLGVATPPDLITDKVRTPFNIGHPIDLKGFTVKEAKSGLLSGLSQSISQAEKVLAEVIYWTGGQPFLTQKLCQLIVEYAVDSDPNVQKIVRQYIIEDWESQDHPQHFRTIRDRLLYNPNNTLKILELTQQILQQKKIIADNSIAQSQLRISGLLVKKEKYLQVCNPIYRAIFNEDWIKEQVGNLRPYSLQFDQWLASNKSENYLLSNQNLELAIQWAKNKNLARDDYEYLSASRNLQNKEEKKQIITANNKLVRNRVIMLSGVIIIVTIYAFVSRLYAGVKNIEAIKSTLNNESNVAVEKFNRGEQLQGLIEAIAVNKKLIKKTKVNQNFTKYLTIKPIESLNQIVNKIQEKNNIKITENSITSVVYTPKDKTIIVGDVNGTVKLWNKQDNKVITWKNSPNIAKIADITIDSNTQQIYLANQTKNTGILVFDLEGNLQKTFKTNNIISSLAISHQNNHLVSGDMFGNVSLWSLDGRKVKTWSAHNEQINKIAVNPTNNQIATASNDSTVKLWTNEGELINTLTAQDVGHKDSINDVAFSPDGKTIATASKDNTIKLWNIDGILENNLSEHTASVNSIAFSSDGKTIVSASDDKTIRIWHMGTLKDTIIGHQNEVKQVTFDNSDREFITADSNGTLKIWQTPNLTFNRFQTGIFLKDKQILLTDSQTTRIKTIKGKTIETIPNPKNKFINTIAFNSNNNTLFGGTEDGLITQLNLKQHNSWREWQTRSYKGAIIAIDVHPINNNLITLGIEKSSGRANNVIKEWNQEGKVINTINFSQDRQITAIKYTPQGHIAIATKNSNIELWDSNSNFYRKIATDTAENITSMAFSPDGKLIATSDKEGNIKLRSISLESNSIDSQLLAIFTQNDGNKTVHLSFTTDGKTIRAVNRYGIISYWNLDIKFLIQRGCSWLKSYSSTEATSSCDSSYSSLSQKKAKEK